MDHNRPHSASASQHSGTRETGAYFAQHDFEGSAELTTTVAHALADVIGVDVTDAGFTLNDHVDPDALDRLFQPRADGSFRMNGYLTFTVWGYQVTVYNDGQIAIVPPQEPPRTRPGPRG